MLMQSMTFSQKASKDKDIHAEGPEQIGRPNFNINHPLGGRDSHPRDRRDTEDQLEGAADGALGHHDGRIENQGPVNLQVGFFFVNNGSVD